MKTEINGFIFRIVLLVHHSMHTLRCQLYMVTNSYLYGYKRSEQVHTTISSSRSTKLASCESLSNPFLTIPVQFHFSTRYCGLRLWPCRLHIQPFRQPTEPARTRIIRVMPIICCTGGGMDAKHADAHTHTQTHNESEGALSAVHSTNIYNICTYDMLYSP